MCDQLLAVALWPSLPSAVEGYGRARGFIPYVVLICVALGLAERHAAGAGGCSESPPLFPREL